MSDSVVSALKEALPSRPKAGTAPPAPGPASASASASAAAPALQESSHSHLQSPAPAGPNSPNPTHSTQSKSPNLADGQGNSNLSNPGPVASNGTAVGTGKKTGGRLPRANTWKDARDGKGSGTGGRTSTSQAPIDPLSQHIFQRTNTEQTIASRLRNSTRTDSPASEAVTYQGSDLSFATPSADVGREKKKGVSFLSRLSMGLKKKDDDSADDASEISELRTDGSNTKDFSVVGSVGYIPHHKEPPRYVRVKSHNKRTREFNRMFLAQELVGTKPMAKPSAAEEEIEKADASTNLVGGVPTKTGGAIWTMEFSKDGKYLAAAGCDQIVRVWSVLSTPEERRNHEEEEATGGAKPNGMPAGRLNAPVFSAKPTREFHGHTGEVLDLSWSKNNFLLSSSMDKTVRLWHMTRKECLCTFKHKDFVTSIAFHPRDDRFFLAGSLDATLRLWSIPDKAVAYSAQLSDIITAVAFSPDGKTSIAGALNGMCTFYETEGLKYHTQLHVRSSRGKNSKGSKITGIQTMTIPSDAVSLSDGDVRVLITSNDSRIRIYNLRDKSVDLKFKGHENAYSQMHATFSDDGKHVICGSEDKRAYVWSISAADSLSENKEKRPCEYFDAHQDMVTAATFAPTQTRLVLSASNDPVYDLCNPPPITLLSQEESMASQTGLSEEDAEERMMKVKKPEESPAYIARSTHYDGHIIVTSDHSGIIRVFRQDCAFAKRKLEGWMHSQIGTGLVGRSASILTRTSAGSQAHSRRGSLSTNTGVMGTPQLNSDILSWRQQIPNGGSYNKRSSLNGGTPARSERSISPTKLGRLSGASSAANLAPESKKPRYPPSSPLTHFNPASPTSSLHTTGTENTVERFTVPNREKGRGSNEQSQPPAASFMYKATAEEEGQRRKEQSGANLSWTSKLLKTMTPFQRSTSSGQVPSSRTVSEAPTETQPDAGENASRRKSIGAAILPSLRAPADANTSSDAVKEKCHGRKSTADALQPRGQGEDGRLATPDTAPYDLDKEHSVVSKLSDEYTSDESGMKCTKCGGRDFKERKPGFKVVCQKCGTVQGK